MPAAAGVCCGLGGASFAPPCSSRLYLGNPSWSCSPARIPHINWQLDHLAACSMGSKLEVRDVPGKGRGVFAAAPIEAGEVVLAEG